jgi:hypothetical protein
MRTLPVSDIDAGKQYLRLLLKHEFPISRAFVFDFFAKGISHPDPGISIAVIMDKMKNPLQMTADLVKLSWELPVLIDPHPITSEDFAGSSPFIDEIKRTGIEIPVGNYEL